MRKDTDPEKYERWRASRAKWETKKRLEDPDFFKRRAKEWREENPEKAKASSDNYKKRNPTKSHDYHQSIKKMIMDAYGGKCVCCGIDWLVFLTIDHIDGTGADHRESLGNRRSASGKATYKWLKENNFPPGFQVLCFNCNFAKSHGGCPHQLEN